MAIDEKTLDKIKKIKDKEKLKELINKLRKRDKIPDDLLEKFYKEKKEKKDKFKFDDFKEKGPFKPMPIPRVDPKKGPFKPMPMPRLNPDGSITFEKFMTPMKKGGEVKGYKKGGSVKNKKNMITTKGWGKSRKT